MVERYRFVNDFSKGLPGVTGSAPLYNRMRMRLSCTFTFANMLLLIFFSSRYIVRRKCILMWHKRAWDVSSREWWERETLRGCSRCTPEMICHSPTRSTESYFWLDDRFSWVLCNEAELREASGFCSLVASAFQRTEQRWTSVPIHPPPLALLHGRARKRERERENGRLR